MNSLEAVRSLVSDVLQEAQVSEVKKVFPSLDDSPDSHRQRLVHLVTDYDRRQEQRAAKTKGYHNQYALGHYLRGVDSAHEHMKVGHSVADAINKSFNGALARHLHKGMQTGDTDIDTKRRMGLK